MGALNRAGAVIRMNTVDFVASVGVSRSVHLFMFAGPRANTRSSLVICGYRKMTGTSQLFMHNIYCKTRNFREQETFLTTLNSPHKKTKWVGRLNSQKITAANLCDDREYFLFYTTC